MARSPIFDADNYSPALASENVGDQQWFVHSCKLNFVTDNAARGNWSSVLQSKGCWYPLLEDVFWVRAFSKPLTPIRSRDFKSP